VPQAGSLWPTEGQCAGLEHIRVKRSKGNTERRILCNFNMTTLLSIAA